MSEQVALAFARALDRDDYDAAALYLHPDCEYRIGSQVLRGAEILESYRANSEKARRQLDEIAYESRVEATEDDRTTVLFIDRIRVRSMKHEFRCHQIYTVRDSLIAAIEHREIEGQRDALNAFFAISGVGTGSA